MNKLRQYRRNPFLVALAVLCAAGPVCAQGNGPDPGDLPIVVDHKQAAALALAQLPPEYPPVAKVNYLGGQVQLQLTVNNKGKVASAHVLEGIAILAESALKATRGWVYRPLSTPSGPSGFMTTVKVRFNLKTRETQLTAQQAERDFLRQVKPAQIVRSPAGTHPEGVVHMRVLVNDQGQVVDMGVSPTDRARFEAAGQTLRGWTFRPARWGTLPIASYLEIDVPVGAPSATRTAANAVSP
jgi:TonB family protein